MTAHSTHAALQAAEHRRDGTAAALGFSPWRNGIVRLLNDALAAELVCMLRYDRHHVFAVRATTPQIAAEFMAHADQEAEHADRLAERIVQLGGTPDFSPQQVLEHSRDACDAPPGVMEMVEANLAAERGAVEAYLELIALIGDTDPDTRGLLEDILRDEQEHADELKLLLADWSPRHEEPLPPRRTAPHYFNPRRST